MRERVFESAGGDAGGSAVSGLQDSGSESMTRADAMVFLTGFGQAPGDTDDSP